MVFMTTDILQATGGKLLRGRGDLHFKGVSIDSRKVCKGDLFVALKGDRFDGHDFAGEVLKKGALGLVVREGWDPPLISRLHEPERVENLIAVPDTLRALQDLAHAYRMGYAIPVVAVTGTNGKTSTKEMIYSILQIGHKVYRSPGNLNNHIGVPLSLLGIEPGTERVVLEFGMSGKGEIRRLREIARPDVVVITNISAAHMMTLKSVGEVARAKAEILEQLPEQGCAILNRDDPRVYALKNDVQGKVITFGRSQDADVSAEEVRQVEGGTRFLLRQGEEKAEIELHHPGLHHVSNALAAAAAARVMKIPMSIIAEGLARYTPLALRWETFTNTDGVTVINDAYNANPESMKAAIRTVEEMGGDQRNIAVLGDMLELGDYSEEGHRKIGEMIAAGSFSVLLTVGKQARWMADEAEKRGMDPGHIRCCSDREEALEKLKEILGENDRILLKASRRMGLEHIAEALKAST